MVKEQGMGSGLLWYPMTVVNQEPRTCNVWATAGATVWSVTRDAKPWRALRRSRIYRFELALVSQPPLGTS